MDIGFVKKARIAVVIRQIGGHIAVGNFGRFAHHIAQLSGQPEAPVFGVHAGRFDFQRGATHRGPRESGNHAHAALRLFRPEDRLAQQIAQCVFAHADFGLRIVQDFKRYLARHAIQLLLEIAHAGLARIAVDKGP